MNDDYKKIQNLLDNVIKVLDALIKKNLILDEEREKYLYCLQGIRKKYFTSDYLEKSPQGYDVEAIDAKILPLDRKLLEAGKKKQQNTMVYIMKTIIYAIGVGHRALTEKEQKDASVVMLRRRIRVDKYMEAIQTAEKMDETIQLSRDLTEAQMNLKKKCQVYEKQINYIDVQRPDILEEIRYYFDIEDMSDEAIEYLDMKSSLERERNRVFDNQKRIASLANIIHVYERELEDLKKDDSEEFVMEKIEKESMIVSISENDMIKNDTSENDKKENSVVDLEDVDVIDLMYDAMEKIMNSPEVNEYIERNIQEYDDLEFSNDLF